jgi:hypothetical protein
MNRFTKSSIATALQIMAIIILFGYPGCSANTQAGGTAAKSSMVRDSKVDLKTNLSLTPPASATRTFLKQTKEKDPGNVAP